MIETQLLPSVITKQPYPLIFVTLSGAHLYGFPSPDSDYDLRGVHVLPLPQMLGLYDPQETISKTHTEEGVEIDVVTYDIKKCCDLLLKKSGNIIEQIYSPLVLHTTPDHDELKTLTRATLCRYHSHHYLGFSQNKWQEFTKTRSIKALLYMYRVLLSGIHLMQTGIVEANLTQLHIIYPLPYIPDLIAQKQNAAEKSTLEGSNIAFHEAEYQRLSKQLEEARDTSKLPQEPGGKAELNDWLLRLRLRDFNPL